MPAGPAGEVGIEGRGDRADEGATTIGDRKRLFIQRQKPVAVPQRGIAHLLQDGVGGAAETGREFVERHGEIAHQALDDPAAQTVFDVVAIPAETPLIVRARAEGKRVITGLEVIAIQALEQFVLYTGVRPTVEQFEKAVAFARQ